MPRCVWMYSRDGSASRSLARKVLMWVSTYELLSSMRFAIALLTIICIVSAIGTVIKQGEPLVNYVDQFGPFWADVFGAIGLYRIYSTPWFLIILAFLPWSSLATKFCPARSSTPTLRS